MRLYFGEILRVVWDGRMGFFYFVFQRPQHLHHEKQTEARKQQRRRDRQHHLPRLTDSELPDNSVVESCSALVLVGRMIVAATPHELGSVSFRFIRLLVVLKVTRMCQ